MATKASIKRQVLDSGTLLEHQEGCPTQEKPFTIFRLGPEDLDTICDLQQQVVATLPDPALYHPRPRERLGQCLSKEGLVIGTLVNGNLVGFRSIFYPGSSADNLGRDIGLPVLALDTVAHLEGSAILPAYKGNRLQIRMTAQALRVAVAEHRFQHLLSTVAPSNVASILDKFAVGMLIVRTIKKYCNLWRHIFYLDLDDPIAIIPATTLAVPARDLATQVSLVEEKGYVGYAFRKKDHDAIMMYARPTRQISYWG